MRNQRFTKSDANLAIYISERYDREVASGNLTPDDASLIKEFLNDQTGKISLYREHALLSRFVTLRPYFTKYTGISTGEVQEGIRRIMTDTKEDGTPKYSQNTKSESIKQMKRFFLWMCDNGYGDNLNEKKLRNIVAPSIDLMTKTAEDILTKEEIEMIIKAARNSRDRAMVAVLYEAGLRSRELSELTWKDIRFNAQTVVINTAGKTGKPRYIPCVLCRQYLAAWKNDYPIEPAPDNYVFITLHRSRTSEAYAPICYNGLVVQIKSMLKRAGIDRHITPHCFRHSRVTHLIQDEMPETYIKKMMWGSVSTDMFQTYAHIVNDDLDRGIAEVYGIEVPEQTAKKRSHAMKPRQCPVCGTVNSPTANYCICGAPLTDEARKMTSFKKEDLLEIVSANPHLLMEVLASLQERIQKQKEERAAFTPPAVVPSVHE